MGKEKCCTVQCVLACAYFLFVSPKKWAELSLAYFIIMVYPCSKYTYEKLTDYIYPYLHYFFCL